MKTRLLIFLSLMMCGLLPVAAQNDTTSHRQWTLEECVNYALANNLNVRRSALNVRSSEINYFQSKMNMLPSINGQVSYGYSWGRGLDPTTNQFIAAQQNRSGSIAGQASWTVFNGFNIQNTIKQNSYTLDATELDLSKSKNDVTVNVITLFINVVFNKELADNARYQLQSSQQQLELTKKQVAAGALPRSDELNLDAQVATNELNLINQENALNLSILQLKQALQIPASADFDVVVPEVSPETLILDQSPDEIYEIAYAAMPEITSAKLKVQSSEFAIRAARGNLYPRLNLNGSINSTYSRLAETRFVPDGIRTDTTSIVGYTAGTNVPINPVVATGQYRDINKIGDQLSDNLYKAVSLSLSIPIFNNHSARSALQRSLITSEQAKINQREIENTLRQTIETAYNDALSASKSYGSSQRQVTAREEAFRMTKQRYDVGAANYVDYQVAENNLFQAKSDLTRAKYNFIFRKKLLDFYQGKPLGL